MNTKSKSVVLLIAVIGTLLFAVRALTQPAEVSPNQEKLLGSWDLQITAVGQGVVVPGLLTFGAEGNVIADEAAAPTETSAHGNWISTDDGGAAYTFVGLFSGEDGTHAGKFKVVGTLQYDADTDTWHGPFKIDVFDPDDQAIVSDHGTFDLTRIMVESMS